MTKHDTTHETDLLVVGGGSGGYVAAFQAARAGIRTTIIEPMQHLGGVCLHYGCIPSKTLLTIAELATTHAHAAPLGIQYALPTINRDAVNAWKEKAQVKLSRKLAALCKQYGVTHIQGWATFQDPRTVRVADSDVSRITFKRAVIAAGSRPSRLGDIQIDSPRVMDSSGALALEDIPRHLLVVGAGYIGLELGSAYAALGSEVTVVELLPSILPGVDADLVKPLTKQLRKRIKTICPSTKVTGMTEVDRGIEITFAGDKVPDRTVFDRVLVAVGRRPNSDRLGLEKTDVEISSRGFLVVDDRFRTADPNIFAVGDIIGEPMLAHKASHQGRVCADILAGKDAAFDTRAIPAVVFTDPEIAWVGLTEPQATDQGIRAGVQKLEWAGSGRAITMGRTNGLTKILFDPQTHKVLGVGITGAHAGEMIAEAVLAIRLNATVDDLAKTVHPHPTLSETIGDVADMIILGG